MKLLTLAILIITSSICYADPKCQVTAETLTFVTPKSSDITNTFWQDDKEGLEAVKRLHISYNDGSTAIIKHRFCSIYSFEVAYYVENRKNLTSIETLRSKLKTFIGYAAHADSTRQDAIKIMIDELNENGFDPSEIIGVSYNGFDPSYGDTGYDFMYFPIEHSSLHRAAIFVEIGIGGMH